MAVNGNDNVKIFYGMLDEMANLVHNAPKNFVFSDKCVVNRENALSALDKIRAAIPTALSDASQLLEDEEKIRSDADAAAQEIVGKAKGEAAEIVAGAKQELDVLNQRIEEARREVEETLARGKQQAQQQAQQAAAEAEGIVQNARVQAQQIVNAGEARAQELMTQENVYRRAEVSAQEMLNKASNEMAQLRKSTFDYLDEMLGQAETYMTGLVNDLQQERNSVNGAR